MAPTAKVAVAGSATDCGAGGTPMAGGNCGVRMTTQEKLVICACMILPDTVAPATCSQPLCAALVFQSVGTSPAPSRLASKGRRIVAGTAKAVPCGVKANSAPTSTPPPGSAGAPAPLCVTVTEVACATAPGGTTSCVPPAPSSVPPAAVTLRVTPLDEGASSEPPQAASARVAKRTAPACARRRLLIG